MLIKIKRTKGNRQPKTQKQKEASSRCMTKINLTKNCMKNPEIAKKNANARRGRKNIALSIRNITNNAMKNPEVVKKWQASFKKRSYNASSHNQSCTWVLLY